MIHNNMFGAYIYSIQLYVKIGFASVSNVFLSLVNLYGRVFRDSKINHLRVDSSCAL